ncbi:MAG: ABC transporter ATP-binding protein [Rickettsiales bacterium]
MSKILKINNLVKHYIGQDGKKTVLNDINLDIEKGSFFGLLGPNGAGKSTLINIVSSVVKKTSGLVEVCGFDLDEFPYKVKKSIGVVPQEIIFDPFLTVFETLKYHAGFFGVVCNKNEIEQILHAVGLLPQANYNTRKLSGGMKRRLLIAKALINKPQLLFLDEPTAGVDIELRELLWQYVRKLNEDGTTIVLTTHYLEEAERLCDEIAVINDGRIVSRDKKNNLLNSCHKKIIKVKFAGKVTEADLVFIKHIGFKKNSEGVYSFFCKDSHDIDDLIGSLKSSKLFVEDLDTVNVKLEDILSQLMIKN